MTERSASDLKDFNVTFARRFWAKVREGSGCWEWTGKLTKKGYGTLRPGGRESARVRAHRASWILHYGALPAGACVLHKCDNPPCVRPSHLFLGSHKDNVADCVRKGRRAPPIRGSSNKSAKLKESDIPQIRALLSQGVRQRDTGRLYGVSQATILHINQGKAWAHV